MLQRPAPADPLFQTFRAQQRGLGELMIVRGSDADGATRTDCMGLAAFSAELQTPGSAVATWFAPLLRDVEALTTDPRRASRLLELQHALIDLVKVIDPGCERFPTDRDQGV